MQRESIAKTEKKTALQMKSVDCNHCVVCLSVPLSPLITDCCHIFCEHCIIRNLFVRSECPVCRNEIKNLHSSKYLEEMKVRKEAGSYEEKYAKREEREEREERKYLVVRYGKQKYVLALPINSDVIQHLSSIFSIPTERLKVVRHGKLMKQQPINEAVQASSFSEMVELVLIGTPQFSQTTTDPVNGMLTPLAGVCQFFAASSQSSPSRRSRCADLYSRVSMLNIFVVFHSSVVLVRRFFTSLISPKRMMDNDSSDNDPDNDSPAGNRHSRQRRTGERRSHDLPLSFCGSGGCCK